jgi:hypothetical protein
VNFRRYRLSQLRRADACANVFRRVETCPDQDHAPA